MEALVLEGGCASEARWTVEVAPRAFGAVRGIGSVPGSSTHVSIASMEIHWAARVDLCLSAGDPRTPDAAIATAGPVPTATVGKGGTIGGTRHVNNHLWDRPVDLRRSFDARKRTARVAVWEEHAQGA
jgi:hypothetical protein